MGEEERDITLKRESRRRGWLERIGWIAEDQGDRRRGGLGGGRVGGERHGPKKMKQHT